MLWVKTFHIVFVASWFAGLFYLPRIFVNLAQVSDTTTTSTLLGMARRLFRFMTILAIPAILLGIWLLLGWDVAFTSAGWMHAKLLFVVFILGYHHSCAVILRKFENGLNKRSHTFYRWFNEIPVLMLIIVTALVVIKPF